jgi:glucose uptake protein GlcU
MEIKLIIVIVFRKWKAYNQAMYRVIWMILIVIRDYSEREGMTYTEIHYGGEE